MDYQTPPVGKDPHLWQLARRRAAFKRHLAVYGIVNAFLWILWYFSGTDRYEESVIPWPLWSTFGWGIGLAFHYMSAYVTTGTDSVEREYNKLVQNKNKQ